MAVSDIVRKSLGESVMALRISIIHKERTYLAESLAAQKTDL